MGLHQNRRGGCAGGRWKRASRATLPAAGSAAATGRRSPPPHLLAGEAEALTHKAVELALVDDPTAMRVCIERILAPYRDDRGGGRHLCPGDRDQRLRPAFAAGRGRLFRPPGAAVGMNDPGARQLLQPIGENLLQIRCRWQNVQQSMQFMIAVNRAALENSGGKNPSPPLRGEREGPAKREGEVGDDAIGSSAPLTLPSPPGRRGRG